MRRIILAALLALILPVAAGAQGINNPNVTGYGTIGNAAIAQALTATPAVLEMDTSLVDSMGICDVATNKGRCTPKIPGRYQITCTVDASATTGPAVGGALLQLQIRKNGATTGGGTIVTEWAQAAAVATPRTSRTVVAQDTFNGTTDYFECYGSSGSTVPVVNVNSLITAVSYTYLGR